MNRRAVTATILIMPALALPAFADPGSPPPASTLAPTAARSRLAPLFDFDRGPTALKSAKDVLFGMPLAEAKQRAPELFAGQPFQPPGLDDVRLSGKPDFADRLGGLVVQLGCKSALRDGMALWGTPTWGYDSREKAKLYYWFFPQFGARATLATGDKADRCHLVIDRYVPLDKVLGPEGGVFGFEREPLLGMTEADVVRVYGDFLGKGKRANRPCQTQILQMPPVEYESDTTAIRLYCHEDQVTAFEIIFYFENRFSLKDDVVAGLRRKFGAATESKGMLGRPIFDYKAKDRAIQFHTDEDLKKAVVHVGRR